ncbi:HET-domain-containing protein [Cadophora sp. DSE1049]|nr:HET-domain-containing protein [Cadophora sp. DSE1049]
MLCEFCANIDLDELSTPEGYKHHASCGDLYRSSLSGCASCKLILESQWERVGGPLSMTDLDSGRVDTQIIVRVVKQNPGDIKRLRYGQEAMNAEYGSQWSNVTATWERSSEISYLWCFLVVVARPGDRSTEYLPLQPFVEATHTKDIWHGFVTSWLRDCLNHEACSPKSKDIARPPTRVIDVGTSDGYQDPYLRHSGEEVQEWVTLSHCWGQKSPLQTTKKTLSSHQKALPLNTIPNLFRDAVAITRELGYSYLWIDSLCIIQDSEEDRAKEIAQMGNIYKNSILTIAADNCRDSNDSILGEASPARARDYTEQGCKSSKNQFQSKMYAFHYQKWCDIHKNTTKEEKTRSLLKSRAWALQEQILSPRTIHWTPLQLVWSCRYTTLSEECPSEANSLTEDAVLSFPDAPPHRHHSTKMICLSEEQLKTARQEPKFTAPGFQKSNDPLQIWCLIVQQFLSRSITYETDSLPAISGLAREVKRHTGYNYLAGLWAQDIHNGLLWSIKGYAKYPDEYVGPSWSWVSLKKTIDSVRAAALGPDRPTYIYDRIDVKLEPVAEFLGTDIVYASDDLFGPIESATLRLKAPCRAIDSFKEHEIKLPLRAEYVQKYYYGDDPSAVRVDDGTIKCWMDDRPAREESQEDLDAAVGELRKSAAVVVRIASLGGSRSIDSGNPSKNPLSKSLLEVLENQNWLLVLGPVVVDQEKNLAGHRWRRIGIARVADDLVEGSDWERREFTII